MILCIYAHIYIYVHIHTYCIHIDICVYSLCAYMYIRRYVYTAVYIVCRGTYEYYPGTRSYLGTALIPNERSTKRRDFGTFPSITPSCTAHESLEMPPNAAARCSDTSST